MSIIGIVCEFNPFHNGHKYLIDSVKKDGDTVVCCMSGNFTQRAEPAVFEKRLRAEASLRCGADIVLELPFLYATATAELFAENAVRILCEFGCDKIAFGVEDDNKEIIIKAAKLLGAAEFSNEIEAEFDENISYPVARQRAFSKHGIDFDLSKPNNILAVEYAKAVLANYPSVELSPIKRVGTEHDSQTPQDDIASASYIRSMMSDGNDFSKYVPEEAMDCYLRAHGDGFRLDSESSGYGIRTLLRMNDFAQFGKIAYMTEELDRRIEKELMTTVSIDEFYDAVKTKRYTHSRVRRAVLSKAFKVTVDDIRIKAPYVRLLGFNARAEKVLGHLALNCGLPVISSYSQLTALDSKEADRVFKLEDDATDIYLLCNHSTTRLGLEKRRKIIKI